MSPIGLGAVVRKVRGHLEARVLLASFLWFVVAVASVLVLAWVGAGPGGWRQGTWGPMLLVLLLLGFAAGGLVAVARIRRHWLAEAHVARSIEQARGLPPGTLRGSLELSRQLPAGVSPGLAGFGERGLLERLVGPEHDLAGPLALVVGRWTQRGLVAVAVALSLLVGLTLLAPARSFAAWSALSTPVRLIPAPSLASLSLAPGDVDVPRGGAVEVSVEAPGRSEVTLHWQAAGDVPNSSTLALESDGPVSFVIDHVSAQVRYWATTEDGARSSEHVITPIDPLFVSELRLELSFPPHTGRLPEEYRGEVPPLLVPATTQIRVDGRASRSLSEGGLRRDDGEFAQPLAVTGSGFSAVWVPRASGVYGWYFRDTGGASVETAPAPLDLTLVPDAPPSVRFSYPASDTVLPLTLRQPLTLELADDYGLSLVDLTAYRVSSSGERGEDVVQRIDLTGAREAVARPLLDLSGWGLLPGDEVRYRARALDNAPLPQVAQTREWVLRMPAAAELRRGAQEQLEETAERLEALSREAERAAEESRNLERLAAAQRSAQQQASRSAGAGPAGENQGAFEQREDVRRSLEQQERISSEVDSLRAELRSLSEAMRDAGLADPGLRSDLDELQRLLEEISTPELAERLREMSQSLDGMDARQAQESMRELSEAQDEFRRRLEESLERFRRAAVEQDFRATEAEADELARLERALAEALREEPGSELRAEQQSELAQRAEEMDEAMRALEERLRQLDEQEAARGVEQGREQTAQARQAMADAEQRAREGQNQQAADRADQAAAAMEQAASELRDARQEMADQQGEALRQALEGAAEESLALARRQAEIRDRMGNAGAEEMAALRGDVGALLQGVRNMADNLASAAQQSGNGDREVSERAGQAMAALESTLDSMEPRPGARPSATGAADGAVDALNQLALAALAGAQQAQGGEGQQGDLMQQLEALAQQQGQLNAETGQLMPMQLGQEALNSQLQDLASGQQSVASQLGDLSNEPGSDQALGDLQALAEEARALSEMLAGGRLDAETRQRQERLFHRLLDAGRSLENEDEFSDEREARTAGEVLPREVEPLSAEAIGALRYRLPDAAVLQRLSPAERQLVLQYFERLNRETPRPEEPPRVQPVPAAPPPGGGA